MITEIYDLLTHPTEIASLFRFLKQGSGAESLLSLIIQSLGHEKMMAGDFATAPEIKFVMKDDFYARVITDGINRENKPVIFITPITDNNLKQILKAKKEGYKIELLYLPYYGEPKGFGKYSKWAIGRIDVKFNITSIWDKISEFSNASIDTKLHLLNPQRKFEFKIEEISENYLRVDKLPINITKEMFYEIIAYLKEKGEWIKIGASRINTKPNTIEWILKKKFFGENLDALSTAPWLSAILVSSNVGVEFNGKGRGQAIRYRM